jgi:hypothetical protein
MARDPLAPADPGSTQDSSVDPSTIRPNLQPPDASTGNFTLDGGDYDYWLRDAVTPYRTNGPAEGDVFSQDDGGWMMQHSIDRDRLWPSSAEQVAGLIGGRHRLTEPSKGTAPLYPGPDEDFSPVESPDYMAEADSDADVPQPPPSEVDGPDADAAAQPMTEQQIRNAGLRIDVPFEATMPVDLKYKDTGQKVWTPPPGWRQGAPPIDDWIAEEFGLPRDLGQEAEGGGSSGETEGSGT